MLARTEWNEGSNGWKIDWNQFSGQLNSTNPVFYLPVFMAGKGMNYAPQITIAAPTASTNQQWLTAGSPIYAVGTGDSGLRWSVLRIKESP